MGTSTSCVILDAVGCDAGSGDGAAAGGEGATAGAGAADGDALKSIL